MSGSLLQNTLEQRELEAGTYSAPQSRSRVRNELRYEPEYCSYWWNTRDPAPVKPAPVANIARGAHRAMDDWVIPGYRRRSAAGETFFNPMSLTRAKIDVLGADGCAFSCTTGGVTYYGDITGIVLPSRPSDVDTIKAQCVQQCDTVLGLAAPDRSALIALASTEARSKISSSDFDAFVSLGELKETLSYLRNPLAGLLTFLSKCERRVNASSGEKAAALAGTYLGVRYGLRPFIKEVESALENLLNVIPKPKRRTVRSVKRQSAEGTKTTLGYVDGSNITYDTYLYGRRMLTVKCGFLLSDEFSSGLEGHWGLRLSDLPSAAWALMPLSFVVDWVANVSKLIGALTPRAGVITLGQWTTIEDSRSVILSGSNYRLPYQGWITTRSGHNEYAMDYTIKTRVPEVNLPSLQWKGFDTLSNDIFRVLDLIGISSQKLTNLANNEFRSLRLS